jgi:riboflavin kinase/FMN adenylyltransferase
MTITIGGFDGMHIAHQALIKKAEHIIVIEKGSTLTPGLDRCEYTTLPCTFFYLDEIKHKKAQEFIETLKNLKVKKIVIGEDFRFGHKREGDINLLKNFFEVEIIKEIKIEGIGVHSKTIREFIKKNEIKKANKFLGHNYKIKGIQIKGQGLGKKELLPTINIELLKNYTLPQGVFITKTNNYPSLTFIGKRSTDNNFSIETHILKNSFEINTLVKIEFLDFLRDNKKFDNISQLKKAILEDVKKAKNYFKEKNGIN